MYLSKWFLSKGLFLFFVCFSAVMVPLDWKSRSKCVPVFSTDAGLFLLHT